MKALTILLTDNDHAELVEHLKRNKRYDDCDSPPRLLVGCAKHDMDGWVAEISNGVEVTQDPEACPGCNCKPGDGVTASCDHPDGCGYFKTVNGEHQPHPGPSVPNWWAGATRRIKGAGR